MKSFWRNEHETFANDFLRCFGMSVKNVKTRFLKSEKKRKICILEHWSWQPTWDELNQLHVLSIVYCDLTL